VNTEPFGGLFLAGDCRPFFPDFCLRAFPALAVWMTWWSVALVPVGFVAVAARPANATFLSLWFSSLLFAFSGLSRETCAGSDFVSSFAGGVDDFSGRIDSLFSLRDRALFLQGVSFFLDGPSLFL